MTKPLNTEEKTTLKCICKQIGANIMRLRKEHTIPPRDCARSAGISILYLGQLEQGKGQMDIIALVRLAHTLHTTPEGLLSEYTCSTHENHPLCPQQTPLPDL